MAGGQQQVNGSCTFQCWAKIKIFGSIATITVDRNPGTKPGTCLKAFGEASVNMRPKDEDFRSNV